MSRFQVFKTDADLSQEPDNLVYEVGQFDIAETKMAYMFINDYPHVDYMIYDREKREIPLMLLTPETLQRRSEV